MQPCFSGTAALRAGRPGRKRELVEGYGLDAGNDYGPDVGEAAGKGRSSDSRRAKKRAGKGRLITWRKRPRYMHSVV